MTRKERGLITDYIHNEVKSGRAAKLKGWLVTSDFNEEEWGTIVEMFDLAYERTLAQCANDDDNLQIIRFGSIKVNKRTLLKEEFKDKIAKEIGYDKFTSLPSELKRKVKDALFFKVDSSESFYQSISDRFTLLLKSLSLDKSQSISDLLDYDEKMKKENQK